MQFIFGDDTSKYTLLHCDDKPGSAEKIQNLVRMSYTPNPDFQSLGFIPFGVNNNRALFFKFQKDNKMKRNVYYLHGVYGEAEPEYFFSDDYVSGLFTGFVEQDQFDALRDQILAGDKNVNVPYTCDSALARTPYDQINIDPIALCEIVTKLYQRTGVVIVMDDAGYSNDRARLLIKKIFRYLTPSLRKLCSYITAVDDTGDMDFMLRIIPRSMLQGNAKCVDLNAPATPYTDKTSFPEIAARLLQMSEAEREALFGDFELLYYGRDSIYRKQNFENFFRGYMAAERSEEAVRVCDDLLTDYLDNAKCPDDPVIPAFLRNMLTQKYSSDAALDGLVDWRTADLAKVDQFYDQYVDVIRKVFYLHDRNLTYFDRYFRGTFEKVYVAADVPQLKAVCNEMQASARSMRDPKPSEYQLLKITLAVYKYLKAVCDDYDALMTAARASAEDYIKRCYNGSNVHDPGEVVRHVEAAVGAQINGLRPRISDIAADVSSRILNECVGEYNAECNRRARQERDQRTKDRKDNIMAAYTERLKADKGAKKSRSRKTADGEAGDGKRGKEKTGKGDELMAAISDDEPIVTDVLSGLDIDPAMLVNEDLLMVAEDEQLRPVLADEVSRYILNVCVPREEQDFLRNNKNLALSSHLQTSFLVAQNLCAAGAVDYAVLYVAKYGPQFDAAVKYILKMKELDRMDRDQMFRVKYALPEILKKRAAGQDKELLAELLKRAKQACEDKEASKACRTVGTIICDALTGKENILQRESKAIMAISAGAIVLVILAVVAFILFNPFGKNNTEVPDGTGGTTASTEATNATTPSDPTDVTDPSNVTEPSDATDPSNVTDPSDATDPGDLTESTEETGSTEDAGE